MSDFYPDDEDRVINSPVEQLTVDELRWEIMHKAENDMVLKELVKGGDFPTGDAYLTLNYFGEPPEWFEGDEGRIRDLLDEYHKRMQPVDLRRVRFERELASISNGADFADLGEEELRQLIKLLFARQREIGRGDEELQDMLRDVRNSSDQAMWIFDMLDDTLH